MSWTLLFFRRVGEPELIIEEVDSLFDRLPRFRRLPSREVDPAAEGEVLFRYENPITNITFDFAFQTPEALPEEEASPGQVDFPYELTPLELRLSSHLPAEAAQEAMPVAAEVCQQLGLLALDPQIEQQVPGPPDVDALIRSFVDHSQSVRETIMHLVERRRRHMAMALAFLVAGLLLLLLSFGLGR
jgi:hypothetical protein